MQWAQFVRRCNAHGHAFLGNILSLWNVLHDAMRNRVAIIATKRQHAIEIKAHLTHGRLAGKQMTRVVVHQKDVFLVLHVHCEAVVKRAHRRGRRAGFDITRRVPGHINVANRILRRSLGAVRLFV